MNLGAPAGRWRSFLGAPGELRGPYTGQIAGALGLALLAGWLARAPLPLAVASLVGTAIFLGTILEPAVGLAALGLAVPFGSLLPLPIPGADIVDLLAGLVIIAWLARGAATRQIVFRPPALTWPVLALVWVLALSLAQATSWRLGLPEWLKWAEFAAVYLIGAQVLGTTRAGTWVPGRRGWVIAALLVAGVLEVALGAYQFLFQVGPKAFILMDRFMRAYGTFAQPNPYAGYLGYLAPVAASLALGGLGRWWQERRPADLWQGLACSVATVALVAGIAMSWSRGSWFGLGVALIAVLGLRNRRSAPIVATLLVALALAWVLFGTAWLPASVARRLSDLDIFSANMDLSQVEINDDNFAVLERLGHWQAGAAMFSDHPWLGVGVGNYAQAYPTYAPPHFYDPLGHAHNVYLNFLAEAGILGGLAFAVFWLAALWAGWRAVRRSSGFGLALAVGVLGSLVYLSVHNMFDNLFVAHMQLQLALLLASITVWKEAG